MSEQYPQALHELSAAAADRRATAGASSRRWRSRGRCWATSSCGSTSCRRSTCCAPSWRWQQARASEARWLRGEPLGPLDGVPVTLKENIATQGDPMPLGTAATELAPAPADAPPAARVREAGGVMIAKTTMPDYGMLSSGLSSFHKLARNPWDLGKTPGRLQRRRRRGGGRGLRAPAHRHRHRRLAAAAGRLVRHLHPQAQPRPHPDRPALHRPRRRAR